MSTPNPAFVEARRVLEDLRKNIDEKNPPVPMCVYAQTINLAYLDKVIELLRGCDTDDQSPEAQKARMAMEFPR